MVDMDDLRRSLDEDDEFFDEGLDEIPDQEESAAEDVLILGLTAPQRMILSIFLFLDVAVLGCMCLIALGRIPI